MKQYCHTLLPAIKPLILFALLIAALPCCKKDDKDIKKVEKELCDDTCVFAGDGDCDDGGQESSSNYCGYGTDCTDCGMRIKVEVEK